MLVQWTTEMHFFSHIQKKLGKDTTPVKLNIQSDLGYPATSGPAHIRISDLAGYERYAWTQQVQ